MCLEANFILLRIFAVAVLLGFVSNQQLFTTQYVYAVVSSTELNTVKPSRLSGPVTSLQFSTDGNTSWIVSGRWRMDVYFDNAEIVPLSIKNFNMTLVMVSADGTTTQRYKLSELEQNTISYDNKTSASTIGGTLTVNAEGEPAKRLVQFSRS